MGRISKALIAGLSLAPLASGQVYFGEERTPDAFTYVQPLNTTILGQYGHSEPVYPSRTYSTYPQW